MPPQSRSTDSSERRDRLRWSLLVFALALAVRGLVVWQLSGSVLFETIIGDGRNYEQWARGIAAGDWIGSEVFYQAPLYPYFLAIVYSLLGDSLPVVRGVQVVLGAAACALLTQAGWRFFSRPVGIAAGLGLALYAPALFSDVSIQKSVLDIFLVCLILWILGGIRDRLHLGACLCLGLSIGALVLTRENALVFPAVLVPWLLARPGPSRGRRLASAAALAGGVALVLAPVALRNWQVGGEFHLTTSQFGHNLFIGNNEAADGTYRPVVHWRGDPRVERQDAIDRAERALGRSLTPAEVSDYYAGLAWEYIRSQPGDWLALMARKVVLTFNSAEMIDTKDQYSHADLSPVLRVTGWVFHFGVLAPLALLGVFVSWPERRRLLPLYLLFLAYTATLLVFYVFARYRIPLVPILALFAAAGVIGFPGFLRAHRALRIAAAVTATGLAALFCNWRLVDRDYMRSVTHYNLGNELFAAGRTDPAIEHYRLAIRQYEDNAQANHNLAALFAGRGDLDRAKAHYQEAIRIAPQAAQSHINLARTLGEMGDPQAAASSYQRALRLTGERADLYDELGQAYAELGEWARAVDAFEHALRLEPGLPEARGHLRDARSEQAKRARPTH